MPKTFSFDELVKLLKKHDSRFEIYTDKGKGSHRVLSHSDVNGRAESYPLKYHGGKTQVRVGHLNAIIRRFDLPNNIFR
ncbi:hypothetical protein MNBD_GAMMA10-2972 [hydrothermal vent metagenome]|uniref:Uncharacterized protein n=1 Tax=hydrothermal vent metagenome TaxID=652676 RepID=A0A3B0XKH3_9ZZZZ